MIMTPVPELKKFMAFSEDPESLNPTLPPKPITSTSRLASTLPLHFPKSNVY